MSGHSKFWFHTTENRMILIKGKIWRFLDSTECVIENEERHCSEVENYAT